LGQFCEQKPGGWLRKSQLTVSEVGQVAGGWHVNMGDTAFVDLLAIGSEGEEGLWNKLWL
jgi:hypothetical protein